MCGIAGIFQYKKPEAPEKTVLALFAEQHRGQESCGLAWQDGNHLKTCRGMGLVNNVFPPEKLMKIKSSCTIGHVRYPTQGGSTLENAQPHLVETLAGPRYSLASNGDLINYSQIKEELQQSGIYLASGNDGEAMLRLLIYLLETEGLGVVDAVHQLFRRLQGAYSTLFLMPEIMVAFRDPYGFRPMLMGEIDDGFAVSSESCALDILRASNIRELEPGEIVIFKKDGPEYHPCRAEEFRSSQCPGTAHCIFELIYFARPDSFQYGKRVYEVRRKIGHTLAGYDDFSADCTVPVPDSSNMIAQGYAEAKQIPFEFGLIRNHYVGRTFIKPEQTFRDESVKQKFNPLSGFFEGKRVILVDDSIVRGTTLRKLVRMVRGAGAREVHIRIGSPPVKFPCFYGIDTPTCEELIANQKSIAEIQSFMEADSLKYLKLEDLLSIVQAGGRFCSACFGGNYPVGTPVPGKKVTRC